MNDARAAAASASDQPDETRRPWLDVDTAWTRVAEAHTAVLTTLRRDGYPVALPLWFTVIDRRLYFRSPASSKKIARIRHDPRASVLVESGRWWRELAAVHLTGRAHIVERGAPIIDEVFDAIDAKYRAFSSAPESLPDATRAYYSQHFEVICFEPEQRIVSWDNSRLVEPT